MLVYKYRGSNEEAFDRAIDGLKYNYFWASSVDQLNDPCEALTNNDNFKNQYWFISKILGFNELWQKEFLNKNTDEVLSLRDRMGIFSLSKTYLNELMWAHYAFNHKGFCIEYELEYLIRTDGARNVFSLPVIYSKSPPSIDMLDIIKSGNDGLIKKMDFINPTHGSMRKNIGS